MSGTGSIFNLSKNNQKNRDKKISEPTITCHQCKISVKITVAKVSWFQINSRVLFLQLKLFMSRIIIIPNLILKSVHCTFL